MRQSTAFCLATVVVVYGAIAQLHIDAASTLTVGYALNEGSGATAVDTTGLHNGALVGTPTWTSAGKFGRGLNLNGASQYVRTDDPDLPTGDFTWALWVNPRSTAGFRTLMEAQGTTASELELNLVNGSPSVWASGIERFTLISTVPTNTWSHVALTRTNGTLRIYIDGSTNSQTSNDSRILNFASCPLLIGVDSDSGCEGALNGFFDGALDEVQVHNRALSSTEIQQIMSAPLATGGEGGGTSDTTPPVRSSGQTSVSVPAGTTQTNISLTTNEGATCRFAMSAGVAYLSMTNGFSTTGSTSHSHVASGLSDGSTRTFYIRCVDGSGNANSDDFTITITVGSAGSPPPPPPPPPSTSTFYVAPNGNDQNPGTLQLPFQTINRARQAVRAQNVSMSTDIQVMLRGGEYNLSGSIAFDQGDSGNNGFDVIYSAYPGEQPLIHGGQHVTGWTSVGSGVYKANAGGLRFRQLYVNGKRAIRARTPNAGSYNAIVFWDTANRRIEVGSGEVANWQRLNQVELVILGTGVNQSNLRISSVNGSVVTPRDPERTRIFQQAYPPKNSGRPYFFENAFEFLDAPGEWYLNTDTNEVFYRPRPGEDLATADVVAPRVETLLRVVGTAGTPVRNLQFKGLTFAYSTWLLPDQEGFVGDQASVVFTQPLPADEITSYPGHRHPAAVHIERTANVVFERNVFTHLGSSGLNLYMGTADTRIIGNRFSDISASGISVGLNLEGNPSDITKVSTRDVIENNYITKTGSDYYQTVGIMAGYADSILIEHNELSDMPYSGISVGWGWENVDNAARNNTVRYNEISNVLTKMSDGGGIYTLSRQPNTLIAENYVHDIVRTQVQGGFNISGVYLDEGSSQITVRDNVLQNTGDRRIFQNGNGPGNVLANNDAASSATMNSAGLESAFDDIRNESASPPPPPPPPPSDTTAPVRSNGQPSTTLPAGTSQTTLSLATDESAACRYSVLAGQSYSAMGNTFATANGSSHTAGVTNLSNGGSYTFYVRCQDGAGNVNTNDFPITFAVSSSQQPPLPPTGTGLVGAYGFNEGSGAQTLDASSNANVGILRNGPVWTAQGRHNSALTFDGVDDYVSVSSPDLPTGDFTWQAWIKGRLWRPFQGVLMARDDWGLELAIDGSGKVLVVHSSGQSRLLSATAIAVGSWVHIAVTRSEDVLRLYLNGVQDSATGTITVTPNFGTCSLLIGADADSGCTDNLNGYFDGELDELRIHNRALTANEILLEMARP